MSEFWKMVELKDGEPVVFLAVHALRWQPEWGEPKVGFIQIDEEEDELRAELARRDEELALTEKKLCNIDRSAREEIARRDEIISRLKEDGERLAWSKNPDSTICICGYPDFMDAHAPDCPITLHRALMKELAEC